MKNVKNKIRHPIINSVKSELFINVWRNTDKEIINKIHKPLPITLLIQFNNLESQIQSILK